MATLYIAEFSYVSKDHGVVNIAQMPAVAYQTVTVFSSVATSSAAFNAKTTFARVYSDTSCFITIGNAVTATTTKLPITANQPEYFGVLPTHTLSVISP